MIKLTVFGHFFHCQTCNWPRYNNKIDFIGGGYSNYNGLRRAMKF